MSPRNVLRLESYWHLQIAAWGCFWLYDLLGSLPSLLNGRVGIRDEAVPILSMFMGSLAMRPVCRWLLRRSQSWVVFELRAAACAAPVGCICACGTDVTLHGFHSLHWLGIALDWMWPTFVLFMWCSLYFSIKQWQQSQEEKERLLRAENELKEARLLALRYQLNPHFLFNSLNAVSTLVLDGDSPAATRMLAQIGDLLRSSLGSEVRAEVTLSQELAFTAGYLAIEQTRLGERLRVDMTIPLETRDAMVPSMLLQPLVENAVRYGVAPLVEGGWISIASALHGERLRLVVGNSGGHRKGSQDRHGSGIGLGNTEERLKTLYGSNFEFMLRWPEEGGCEVVLELPFRHSGLLREAAPCAL